MNGTPIKVAIAGGGIAGLALAAGLAKKPHIDVHVYEAVREYRDVGAGLALHLNATQALGLVDPSLRQAYLDKALSMAEEEDQVMATEVILAHGPHSGQRVAELGKAKGRKTVSRADLLDGFLDLVPHTRVSFGKRLVSIEEAKEGKGHETGTRGGVTLVFEDGSRASADCLLGADGVHSVVRRHMLGADHPAANSKNHDGWQIHRVMVPTAEARKEIDPKWTQNVPILLGPLGHINCIPLNKNTRLSAGVAIRRGAEASTDKPNDTVNQTDGKQLQPGPSSPSSPPALDPNLYSDYSADAQAIVRMIASRAGTSQSASWALRDHDHAPFYARGGSRVAIIGDAAHAALPFAGNGAAQALEDAAVLDCLFGALASSGCIRDLGDDDDDDDSNALARVGEAIEDALLAFDHVRRPRSQAVVDLARKFGRIYAYAEDGSKRLTFLMSSLPLCTLSFHLTSRT